VTLVKRTIEGDQRVGLSKALAPVHRHVSEERIDKLISIAGPLPDHRFPAFVVNKRGKYKDVRLGARDYFVKEIESAATSYYLQTESRTIPTNTQLAIEFRAIEQAASRLLRALQVGPKRDIDHMPDALRYGGLQAEAAGDAYRLDKDAKPLAGATLLRKAIEGVDALQRWAQVAKKRQLQQKWQLQARLRNELLRKQETAKKRGIRKGHDQEPFPLRRMGQHRNEGNKPFNDYLHQVILACWVGVYGRRAADGPSLREFVQAAADAVGVKLKDDAARERLRRVLGRRRPPAKRAGESTETIL
jgi:hypothetical protein